MIAVIHRGHGVDVLIAGRVWLRRRVLRVALKDLRRQPGGRLEFQAPGARELGSRAAGRADR